MQWPRGAMNKTPPLGEPHGFPCGSRRGPSISPHPAGWWDFPRTPNESVWQPPPLRVHHATPLPESFGRTPFPSKHSTPSRRTSAAYLTKFGSDPAGAQAARAPGSPLGEQFTTQRITPLRDGPSATQLGIANRQRDNQYGGVSGFAGNLVPAMGLSFETQNTLWNYFQEKAIERAGDHLDWDGDEAKAMAW